MPIYAYHCTKCGHDFDELKNFSDRDTTSPCPSCGATTIERNMTAASVGRGGSPGGSPSTTSSGGCAPRGGFS